MGKYKILRHQWFKKYVYLLSLAQTPVGISSIWSVHEFKDGNRPGFEELVHTLQLSHDMQIDKMIIQEMSYEKPDPNEGKIMDITQQQLNGGMFK